MSTLKHPVGPQSGRVYWRRRAAVLIGLLAVIVVVVLIIVRPGAGNGEPAKTPPATTTGASNSSTPNAQSDSTTIPTDATTADGAACKAANIALEAKTDATSYASGRHPLLSLSLTNTGAKACRIDAGTDNQVYTITSGTEQYWVSTDCQKDSTKTEILLAPHKTVTSQPFEWDRTRSDPKTCDADRPAVPAGGASYHLKVKLGDVASTTTKQFLLY
ncbi:hypothetical protein OSC27_12435 [Microbacterium sp. STN6]|uniref:hypothetical protein n=1 Tax=Microbacterium sp. STN6 TaxID=2995588 RepID=UPI0022608F5C|nr:hypothetical protein [Microbacterium sp. STN6]MCX7523079.1 hypothetical protein [Microbacterium sp. STN6]